MNQMDQNEIGADPVRSTLNYIVPGATKPVTFMYAQPSGASVRNGEYKPYPVSIRNGRRREAFSLDAHGFVLRDHASSVDDFHDGAQVRARYYPEIERLVCAETGAQRAFMFDHTLRSIAWSERGTREPVRIVHNDYTLTSGPRRVRDLLGDDEAVRRLARRFAVINVWRPIVDVVQDTPLAICDAGSMRPADFIATDLKYADRTGEVYSVSANPEHRWYYFPRMRRDEVLMFKCFDSAEDGRARFGAHSAFDDPASVGALPQRESIEARLLVFF